MRGNSGAPYRNRKTDGLVRKYLAAARTANANAQSYGGSTGGRKSIDTGSGLSVLNRRSAEAADKKKVFEKLGSGEYGGRAASWEARRDLGT